MRQSPDLHVLANCARSNQALDVLDCERIDLVLLDYDLGDGETGFQFIREARDRGYTSRILSAGMSHSDSVRAPGLSVCGIFLKHSSPASLGEAIPKVIGGETWIDQRSIQALIQSLNHTEDREGRKQLTERERQVLNGVFEGLSNKQISARLNISEASIKWALQQLFLKTGVRTRSQLVRVALEEYSMAWRVNE